MRGRTNTAVTALHLGGRHSRRVDRLRFILPITALLMLITVMAWPWLNGGYHGFIMPVFNQVVGAEGDPMRMLKPRYVGQTKDQEPYEVTAVSAFLDPESPERIHLDELTAILEQNDDETVHLEANEGLYFRDRGMLDLKGDLVLRLGERYTFNTAEASVNFAEGRVVGQTPITGEGPMGTLAADQFAISDGGNALLFNGRVHVVYQPGAPSL